MLVTDAVATALTELGAPAARRPHAQGTFPTAGPTAVFRTIYVWRREYAPADASAGRSATACAVTLYTSGAATARIAERSLGARSLCMGSGPSRRSR
jgi:hypothetical protein